MVSPQQGCYKHTVTLFCHTDTLLTRVTSVVCVCVSVCAYVCECVCVCVCMCVCFCMHLCKRLQPW